MLVFTATAKWRKPSLSTSLDETPQHDHVDYSQSAPCQGSPKQAASRQSIRPDGTQLLGFKNIVQRLGNGFGTGSQIKAAESKARGYRASVTKKSFQQRKLDGSGGGGDGAAKARTDGRSVDGIS